MLAKISVGHRYSELPKGFATFRYEYGQKPRSDAPANGKTTEVQSPRYAERRDPVRDVMGEVRVAVAVGMIGLGSGGWRR